MNSETRVLLKDTLDALERLLDLFKLERIVHLVVGIVAFLMLLYAIVLLFRSQDVTAPLLTSLFGSSGLIAISSARITYFFNKAFKLVEDIIRSLIQPEKAHGKRKSTTSE